MVGPIQRRRVIEFVIAWNLGKKLDNRQSEPDNQVGEILFVEAGLTHQLEGVDEFVVSSNDGARKCQLRSDSGELHLTPFAPEMIPQVVKSHRFLVRTHRLQSLPVNLYEQRPPDSLTVSLGATMQPGRNLQLDENYDRPDVRLEPDGSGVVANIAGESLSVRPHSEVTKTLEPRQVTALRPTDEFKQVPDRRGGTQQCRTYETVSQPVIPELQITHHGRVAVRKITIED